MNERVAVLFDVIIAKYINGVLIPRSLVQMIMNYTRSFVCPCGRDNHECKCGTVQADCGYHDPMSSFNEYRVQCVSCHEVICKSCRVRPDTDSYCQSCYVNRKCYLCRVFLIGNSIKICLKHPEACCMRCANVYMRDFISDMYKIEREVYTHLKSCTCKMAMLHYHQRFGNMEDSEYCEETLIIDVTKKRRTEN